MQLIVPTDSESNSQFDGSKAMPSRVRVLAIDIHTSDGQVIRLSDIQECEMGVYARKSNEMFISSIKLQVAKRKYTTELIATAHTVTTYDEPAPAKKRRARK